MQLTNYNLKQDSIETLIIPVCQNRSLFDNRTILSVIKDAQNTAEFSGKNDEELILYDHPKMSVRRLVFLGMGKFEDLELNSFRKISGKGVNQCIKKHMTQAVIAVPSAKKAGLPEFLLIESMMEGAVLANHIFDFYKQEKKQTPLSTIDFLVSKTVSQKYKALPEKIDIWCQGTILAREWVSKPPNEKRPEQLAEEFVREAQNVNLDVTVLDEKNLKAENFGAILAVARGSSSKPRMVILKYLNEKATKTVALVGKGVTFDSGGINIKTTPHIRDMKTDMAGAATVAATLITMAKIRPRINIIGLIPIVENMPSGDATRPGDVIRTYEGKTVEIGNTDAEGRLILADAMSYAVKKYSPDMMVDFATLTGACVIALGEKIAGVFSLDEQLAERLVDAGQRRNERCWKMPLPTDYKEYLKSDIADISNMSSSTWGGAITAALFLSEFAGDTPWAHIDIAGPSAIKKKEDYCRPGGTGFGVRLLADLFETMSEDSQQTVKK